jgi:hypothetical protein
MSNRDLDVDVVTPFVVEPAKPIGNCPMCGILVYEGDESCFACDASFALAWMVPPTRVPLD